MPGTAGSSGNWYSLIVRAIVMRGAKRLILLKLSDAGKKPVGAPLSDHDAALLEPVKKAADAFMQVALETLIDSRWSASAPPRRPASVCAPS